MNREFEATYVQADFVPLTQEEVRSAVMLGGNRKSVGEDLVPQELLKELVQKDDGCRELAAFFNDIFLTKSKPDTWNTSVMTLLAKVAEPTSDVLFSLCHICQLSREWNPIIGVNPYGYCPGF